MKYCHQIWKKIYKLKIIVDEFISSLNIMFSEEKIRLRKNSVANCFFH